jgi:hypothetical protein
MGKKCVARDGHGRMCVDTQREEREKERERGRYIGKRVMISLPPYIYNAFVVLLSRLAIDRSNFPLLLLSLSVRFPRLRGNGNGVAEPFSGGQR